MTLYVFHDRAGRLNRLVVGLYMQAACLEGARGVSVFPDHYQRGKGADQADD